MCVRVVHVKNSYKIIVLDKTTVVRTSAPWVVLWGLFPDIKGQMERTTPDRTRVGIMWESGFHVQYPRRDIQW